MVLMLHYCPFQWKVKKVNLLMASYLFYAVWNPPFVLLLVFSTILDFFVGKKLSENNSKNVRKILLSISLLGNLGPLIYFKYGAFILENFTSFLGSVGIDYHAPALDIILPIGISFYTFQTLSYTLDMYRRKYAPVTSLLDFALFVTFFPQLVAGPIVRPDELIPQFKEQPLVNKENIAKGIFLVTLGLFMKVVLADCFLASPANEVFDALQKPLNMLDAWTGLLAFSGQIFFDFGGYSTCAIGTALCLGFTIGDNFLYPYAAVGFSDFWKRWHITLSTWLRDYLYIPLGGNKNGIIKTNGNLILTMLIGGLWHGASWTFVVWGGLHGLYLVIEKYFKGLKLNFQPPKIILAMITFFLVLITWVFFRADSFHSAWVLINSMFITKSSSKIVLNYLSISKVWIIMTSTFICHWYMRDLNLIKVASTSPNWALVSSWSIMAILLVLSQESTSSFIYFQF